MKVAIFLLCLLPLAFGEKKALFANNIFPGEMNVDICVQIECAYGCPVLDGSEIHNLISAVVNKFGSDATEQECEQECLVLFTNDILDLGCDFACKGIQNLIQKVHHDTTVAATK